MWGNLIQLGNFCLFMPCALRFCGLSLYSIGTLGPLGSCIDYYVWIIAGICLLTTQVRSFDNVQHFTVISFMCVIGMVITMVIGAFQYEHTPRIPAQWFGNPEPSPGLRLIRLAGGFTIGAWAFIPAFLTVELSTCMRNPADFKKSLLMAGSLNVLLFALLGCTSESCVAFPGAGWSRSSHNHCRKHCKDRWHYGRGSLGLQRRRSHRHHHGRRRIREGRRDQHSLQCLSTGRQFCVVHAGLSSTQSVLPEKLGSKFQGYLDNAGYRQILWLLLAHVLVGIVSEHFHPQYQHIAGFRHGSDHALGDSDLSSGPLLEGPPPTSGRQHRVWAGQPCQTLREDHRRSGVHRRMDQLLCLCIESCRIPCL